MGAVDDVGNLIEQYHLAQGEFVKGHPEPLKELFSHRADVSLANPLGPAARGIGPVARGWEQVSETQEDATSRLREGEIIGFETVAKQVTAELAYIVEIERYKAKVGGREDLVPIAVRVTSILRPEDGGWKVVHRHADPVVAARPAQSVIQE